MRRNHDFANLRLLLIGCGKMGSALLKGWFAKGLAPVNIDVKDPSEPDWLQPYVAQGLRLNPEGLRTYEIIVVATKPQFIASALESLAPNNTHSAVILSVAAGVSLEQIETALGREAAVVRAMPNTPAEIGQGMTCLVSNGVDTHKALALSGKLMSAVGAVEVLDNEDQMHAVTGLSGSGPAYVFAMAEAMEAAGRAEGLPGELARRLAIQTIKGAGMLMSELSSPPSDLREAVTSPNGTTAAALNILQDRDFNLEALMTATISAATKRSRALAENS